MPAGKGFPNVIVATDDVTRRITQGLAYFAIANDPEVAQGEAFNVLLRTPAEPSVSANLQVFFGSQATFEFYEGATITDPGTPVLATNYKRIAPVRAPEMLVFQDPVIGADGTPLIANFTLPGGTQGKNTAGGSQETLFFILDKSTDYIARLINNSNTDTNFDIVARFVENLGPLSSGT